MKAGILYSLLAIFFLNPELLFSQKTTYNKDIAVIIEKNCTVCHNKNGNAPFSLSRYKEILPKAKFIAYVTEHRIMPPWKANPEYVHFKNERVLDSSEIAAIRHWVEGGCRKGGLIGKKLSAERVNFKRKPDLELKMSDSLFVKGDNRNRYIAYKMPYKLKHDTFCVAFEFAPGNKKILHHASFKVLRVDEGADHFSAPFSAVLPEDRFMDDVAFYDTFNLKINEMKFPEVLYSNAWLPGSTIQYYGEDLSFLFPANGVIFFNYLHYSPTPIDQKDLSSIRFYFSESRPKKQLREVLFKPNFKGNEGLIPADSIKRISFFRGLSRPMEIHAIIPHMHLLGRYFKVYAIQPTGDTIPLIEIPRWDFYWQEYYRFEKPVKLLAGSVIHVEGIYDNTSENPFNPNIPPQNVLFEGTMDANSEMMHLLLLYSE